MMRFHWLRLRATAHATEPVEHVRQAMLHLTGLDDETFDAVTEIVPVESHHGGEVFTLETTLKRSRDIRTALARLLPQPGLAAQVEARTDDDGVFYLRFDKQAAHGAQVVLVQGEDAIQVRLRPEVHPAKRENAVRALQELLGESA